MFSSLFKTHQYNAQHALTPYGTSPPDPTPTIRRQRVIRIRTARMAAPIPQRALNHHQIRRRIADHGLASIGRQRILAIDLRLAAASSRARPNIDVLGAGVVVGRALRAVVLHAKILLEIREIDNLAWSGSISSGLCFEGGGGGKGWTKKGEGEIEKERGGRTCMYRILLAPRQRSMGRHVCPCRLRCSSARRNRTQWQVLGGRCPGLHRMLSSRR